MIEWRRLEVNGGTVAENDGVWHLQLPAGRKAYADAQIDDYGGRRRRDYLWRPGTRMRLRAQFSGGVDDLLGTAGFGFWNAPFGDPTVPWPGLPQATWFFFGSAPGDLPLAPAGPGRGWFASTLAANRLRALTLAPLAPFVLLANQSERLRRRLWPWVRAQLGISYAPIQIDIRQWHVYELDWATSGCRFWIDGQLLLATQAVPVGPLGFVCWLDNQFMRLTPTGRFGWGTLVTDADQWLRVAELEITTTN